LLNHLFLDFLHLLELLLAFLPPFILLKNELLLDIRNLIIKKKKKKKNIFNYK
jgi:hypothetical protein